MFNKSIAYRLSIYISLAVIGVFIAYIIIAFLFNNKIMQQNIEAEAIGQSTTAKMLVEKQLFATKEIASNISVQAMYYAQNNDMELFVSALMKKYTFLNAIRVDFDSVVTNIQFRNYFCSRPLQDSLYFEQKNEIIYFCPNEKRIFEGLRLNKYPGWSEVFTCPRSQKIVVSFYYPIQIENVNKELVSVGSVICELSLLALNDAVNNMDVGENGYAFIVSNDGTYITHPNKDLILNQSLYALTPDQYDTTSVNIDSVLHQKVAGSTFAYPEYLNYKKSWVYYSPIAETGWGIIFLVPWQDLFKPLYLLILRMLFFSVLGILVIFLIVTYISNKLIQPLSTVTTQLKEFSSLTGKKELETLNEVEMVSESLNYLESWYEKFKVEETEKEKINFRRKHDLFEASEIQMSLINTNFSIFSERNDIDLFAIYKPARIVSGDLFDFFFIDDDHLFLSIGDVSGKGISAAFFMSVAQTIIKGNAKYKHPKKIITKVNNELFTINKHQFFLTLFVAILNLKTGVLTYSNAAHTSTVVFKENKEIVELGQSHGLPLGLYPDKTYQESKINLEKGDSIIFFTDGVTELQNEKKEHFGNDRLYSCLKKLSNFNPKNMITHFEKEMKDFKGKASQADDITLMTIKYKSIKKA